MTELDIALTSYRKRRTQKSRKKEKNRKIPVFPLVFLFMAYVSFSPIFRISGFWSTQGQDGAQSSERKRHINFFHINFLCPPFVPGIVPGTNRVCPRDKPGEIGLPLCRIRRIPGFVPVFHRICPRDKLGLSLGQIR